MIQKRNLGTTGPAVAPLAFGGNVFGWTVDEAASFRLLDEFVAGGFNLIDTADTYSRWVPGNKGGESETIIGNWLRQRGHRDRVVIATKVGGDMGSGRKNLSRDYILQGVEASLRRLQTDYIDLYQTHYDDPDTPVEETMETLNELVRQGKVRAIGASNFSPGRLKASLAYARDKGLANYQTLQPEYNLYSREKYETEYEPLVKEYGLGVLPYYALASGFLTGKYRTEEDVTKSARGGGVVKKYLNERGLRIVAALDKAAAEHGTTPASVALAWLMARPTVTAPIASATSGEQLRQLMGAAALRLSEAALGELEEASRVSGE